MVIQGFLEFEGNGAKERGQGREWRWERGRETKKLSGKGRGRWRGGKRKELGQINSISNHVGRAVEGFDPDKFGQPQ